MGQVYDTHGQLIRQFGSFGSAPGQFDGANGLCVDRVGQWMVCDTWNNRVQVFTLDGRFVTALGGFVRPCSIAVNQDGRIAVGDLNCVHVVAFVDAS